jgi:transcriptional regulator with XRE-family HTH domain
VREDMKNLIEKELQRFSQTRLAGKIGISQATIHKILYTDTILTVPTLEKLARYFRVPVSNLLDPGEKLSPEFETLSADEQQLLVWFRYLCDTDHDDEAIKYVKFLAENYGFTPNKKRNITDMRKI